MQNEVNKLEYARYNLDVIQRQLDTLPQDISESDYDEACHKLINQYLYVEKKVYDVVNYAQALENREAELKAKKQAIQAQLDFIEKHKENAKFALKGWLGSTGERKKEVEEYVLSFRKSTSIEIEVEARVPDKYIEATLNMPLSEVGKTYLKYLKSSRPMKTEIKKAIETGEDVPGAKLIEKDNLQIKD